MSADEPNEAIRAVRVRDFRMSRSEFAKKINAAGEALGENTGCTPRLIAAWERGEVACPRPVYERILHELTGRSLQDLGFASRRPDPPRLIFPTTPLEQEPKAADDGVERRTFLHDGAWSAAGAALIRVLPTSAGRRIGMREVSTLTTATQALYAHDHDHGSAALRHDAAQALHMAHEWLNRGRYTEATGRQLRSAAGQLSIAAGWLSYDSGHVSDARSLYNEALAAARIAQDAELEAHSFGCLSLLAKASGRPREAISAAQVARTVARPLGSPRMLALFAMREANGWALLGDRSACDAAIVDAHTHYAKGPTNADPAWLEFFTPAELAGLESLCRADLGQHERAAYGAEQAILLHANAFARNRALYTADVAIQHAIRERPDAEAAADAAGRVLAFLPEVRSHRLIDALRDVETALHRHAQTPAVAEWLEEYRTTTGAN